VLLIVEEDLGVVPGGEETLVKREDRVSNGKMEIRKLSGNKKALEILNEGRKEGRP
jgi:hypothetical protein